MSYMLRIMLVGEVGFIKFLLFFNLFCGEFKNKIMELNKNNRASLLEELTKAKEELSLEIEVHKKVTDSDRLDRLDIRIFLLQEKIKLIEESLIDNKIDF